MTVLNVDILIQTSAGYSTVIDLLCNGGTNTACVSVVAVVNATCTLALNTDDSNTSCNGTCDTQLVAIAAAFASSIR